jgi:hypothetical protein
VPTEAVASQAAPAETASAPATTTAATAEVAAPAEATAPTQVAEGEAPEPEAEAAPAQEEQAPDVSAENSEMLSVSQELPGLPTESKLQSAVVRQGATRRMYVRLGSEGFISKERIKAAASVVGSHLEKMMYTQHDKVFISLGEGSGVEVGQRFTAYQVLEQVRHPVTGSAVGYRIKQLGILEVEKVHEEVSSAKIIVAYDAIDKKSLLMPFEPYEKTIYPQPTPDELKGYVVASANQLNLNGEHQIIYVDRGTEDNLNIGQSFEIFKAVPRESDVLTGKNLKIPEKVLGAGIVVDAGPSTAAVLIWNSRDVIEVGDQIRPLDWQANRTY